MRTPKDHPMAWVAPTTWRDAKATRCYRCRNWTVTGYDDDTCAFRVQADITPLNEQGAAMSWFGNRECLHLRHIAAGRIQLQRISRWESGKAAAMNADIVAIHECGIDIPAALTASPRIAAPNTTRPDTYAEPPF